jgi:integrase/recombinase XerD
MAERTLAVQSLGVGKGPVLSGSVERLRRRIGMPAIDNDIGDYFLWLKVHNYAVSTTANRECYLGYFSRFAKAHDVTTSQDVSTDLVRTYQAELYNHRKFNGDALSPGTQAQRLVAVRQFFIWLVKHGRVPFSPAESLEMPRPDRRLPEATLSALEASAVMRIPDVSRPLGLRDRAILEVFYSCGLRRAELIDLAEADVDFGRATVFVRHGKGAKDRYVPIGERALFWLRLYLGYARPELAGDVVSDRLFITSNGTPICPDWLCRRVRLYFAAAEVTKRGSCHLLRHSVATLMLEGAPISDTSPKCLATQDSKRRSATRG